MTVTLGAIYTLAEATEQLAMNQNALARLARRQGLCGSHQRDILFDECDIECLGEVLEKAEALGIRPCDFNYRAEAAMEVFSGFLREENERKSQLKLPA
jgi:hypothetical protein